MKIVLNGEPDMELVSLLHRADKLEEEVARTAPDVILLDIGLPGRNALDAMNGVLAQSPNMKVLLFSGQADPEVVERGLKAGAWGSVKKGISTELVLDAIRRAGAPQQDR